MKSFRDFVRVNGRWTRVDKQRNTKGRCLIIDSWIISQCERHFNNHRESRGSTRCVKTLAIFYWIATTGGANLRFTAKVVWHKHKWRHLLFLFLRETNIYGLLFSPLHPFRRTCGNEMFSLKLPTDMQIRGRGCTAHYKSSMFSFWNETFFSSATRQPNSLKFNFLFQLFAAVSKFKCVYCPTVFHSYRSDIQRLRDC